MRAPCGLDIPIALKITQISVLWIGAPVETDFVIEPLYYSRLITYLAFVYLNLLSWLVELV